jgi:hypothetical protein
MAYDQKNQAGRGPMMKTGKGVPSVLLQQTPATDEKKGTNKLNTEKDPNLSQEQTNLISDGQLAFSTWKKINEAGGTQNVDMKALQATQRDKDSIFMVKNKLKRFDPGVSSGGGGVGSYSTGGASNVSNVLPSDVEYKNSDTGKMPQNSSAIPTYQENTFIRNPKTGKVSIAEYSKNSRSSNY